MKIIKQVYSHLSNGGFNVKLSVDNGYPDLEFQLSNCGMMANIHIDPLRFENIGEFISFLRDTATHLEVALKCSNKIKINI